MLVRETPLMQEGFFCKEKILKLNKNGFYIISDQFFRDFPDPNLKGNHDENRPHYYCFKAEDTGLYWVIPLSSRANKYKAMIEKFEKQNRKPCDKFHILKIAGRESVFLIQDIFPITEEYFEREYTIGGSQLKLLDQKQIGAIEKKTKKIMNLVRRKVIFNPTQPDVLEIERELLAREVAKREVASTDEEN